jgi:hypothetical protein
LFGAEAVVGRRSLAKTKVKSKVKGVGQECPTHTGLGCPTTDD